MPGVGNVSPVEGIVTVLLFQTWLNMGHNVINSMFLEPSIGTCPLVRCCQTTACHSSPSQHHHHDRTIWTEPVRYWRKACRIACLNHTVLLQIILAISPTLHSIIVLADDPRGKRRPKGNSTLDYTKKRLSLSIYFKCLTLVI